MKSKLIGMLVIITMLFMGCGEESVTNPGDEETSGRGTINLSGAASGSYDAEIGFLNSGDAVTITLGDKDGNVGFILSSDKVKTGTFSIPDEYEIIYSNAADTVMADFHTGTVTINSISTLSVDGSFTGSAYPMSLSTFITDSTKTVNVTATFSL